MAYTTAVEVILSFPSFQSLRYAQTCIFFYQCGADRKNDFGIIPGSRQKFDYKFDSDVFTATVLVAAKEAPFIRDKIYALAPAPHQLSLVKSKAA